MRWIRAGLAALLVAMGTVTAVQSVVEARTLAGARPDVWTESAYTSVFKDSARSSYAGDRIRLDTAKNDYEGAQIVLRGSASFTVTGVDFSALTGPADTIPASELSYNPVAYQYLNRQSTNIGPLVRAAPGEFPDRLLNDRSIAVQANQTQAIWVRVHVPAEAAGGVYTGWVTVRTTNGDLVVPIRVNARDVVIPPANQSEFTNVMWTNFLGLTSYDPGKGDTVKLFYNHDRYSPAWWQLIDNWADHMKRYRQNNLQLPLINLLTDGGSQVDAAGKYTFNFSRFDQVVQRFLDKGVIHTLEGATGAGPQTAERNSQWPRYLIEVTPKQTGRQLPDYVWWDSAEGENWYRQFYPALRQHLIDKGWHDKFWTHVGDEPRMDAGGAQWFKIADKIRQYWPDVKLADATVFPMSGDVVKKADIVIPNMTIYTDNPGPFDAEHNRTGKPLWLYNCMGPGGDYFNRFIDQPQWHQRQTMWFGYSRGMTGYLHWAYNNWQFEMESQDQKGDGYIVRPDKARNTLEVSTRYESLRDGMEDWEVLNKLGKTNPGLAKDLAVAVAWNGNQYSQDSSYMQRIRAIALDAAAGAAVVAKDLARARTATASSGEAAKAVDGNGTTGWQPASGSGTNWVQVDLGRQTQVDGLRLRWGSTHATAYRVLTSFNGTKWTALAPGKGDGGDDFIGFNAKARFIRVEATASSGGATPYELLDLEVAGNHLLQQNLAGGKLYELPAQNGMPDTNLSEATDGITGHDWSDGRSFGWNVATVGASIRPAVTIDLGFHQSVGTVRVHAYEDYPDYRPDLITVSTSGDGVHYTNRAVSGQVNGASGIWYDLGFDEVRARFVRVTFDKTRHEAKDGSLLLDEIEVYATGSNAADVVPGRSAYQWNEVGGAGHEVVFAPTATGTLARWDWSAGAGLKRTDWGGGPIAGNVTGYSWPHQQHAVARGQNGRLLHWWWIEGEPTPHFADWGGDAAGDPAAVVWGGQQHIFTRSSKGDLSHWWWDPADGRLRTDNWGGAPGAIVGTPSAFVWANQLHVVARSTDNRLYHWWWTEGEFEPHFTDWGGEAYSDPSSFTWNGQQHVFTQAADGQLHHWYWESGTGLHQVKWGGAPGKFIGAPSAFKDQYQQHVVARGPNNTLYHWWWDQRTGRVTWEDRGGQVHADPVAFTFEDQHQYFAQSATNTLYHWWWRPQDDWHQNDWGGSVKHAG